jgi:hypothetical protein
VIKTLPEGAGVDASVVHGRGGRHHPSKLIEDVYVSHERKERDEDY